MMARLPQVSSEPATQTGLLFVLDGLANGIDFLFHFWMGRVLIPSEFAILQTLNSIALVYTTASGVFQPVVSRFIAESGTRKDGDEDAAIFQTFLRAALWLGSVLAGIVLLLSGRIATLFNLPRWTIQMSAVLVLLGTLRPIAAGALQGKERFLAFGLTRLALSVGRIVLVFFLIQAGSGLTGAVAALPFGWLISVLCASLLLGRHFWIPGKSTSGNLLVEGWRLSFYALLAYLAYMTLTSLDLLWVNRYLPGETAGAYASLVLMRRIVALLPGVAVTVMFPRVVRALAGGNNPALILAQTAAIILVVSGGLSLLYFIFNDTLIQVIFGTGYLAAAPLLGWMGLAMMGISLSSIWLNYYLAEKPRSFVLLLGIAVGLEWIALRLLPPSIENATLAFGATGWLLTAAGTVLYLFRARRTLTRPGSASTLQRENNA
jgi:O-antigen/teichoic acid export membrane protein